MKSGVDQPAGADEAVAVLGELDLADGRGRVLGGVGDLLATVGADHRLTADRLASWALRTTVARGEARPVSTPVPGEPGEVSAGLTAEHRRRDRISIGTGPLSPAPGRWRRGAGDGGQ